MKVLSLDQMHQLKELGVDTANSRLMAAAPNMLEALECIYNDKEVWSELSDTQKTMVEQAIKKAIK